MLSKTRYVGEVGLDAGPRFYKSFDQQKDVFAQILSACADARDKVLSVHSVRSSKVVLDMIEHYLPSSRGRVVLHWFTGTPSEARRATDLGCYFSINSAMLISEKRRKLIQSMPLNRILTETDGPFTDTVDRPAGPSDVSIAVSGLADLFDTRSPEIARAVEMNLKSLLMN